MHLRQSLRLNFETRVERIGRQVSILELSQVYLKISIHPGLESWYTKSGQNSGTEQVR
jgi:hypothetical protein